jgi:hypothetical protein
MSAQVPDSTPSPVAHTTSPVRKPNTLASNWRRVVNPTTASATTCSCIVGIHRNCSADGMRLPVNRAGIPAQ